MNRIKDLRMQLTPDQIKNILLKFGVYPNAENDTAIIFPTVCHNLEGGSPKLYYYKDEKIFKCYTECSNMFDIFELLIKMKKLRGIDLHLREAIAMTGVDDSGTEISDGILHDLQYLRRLKDSESFLEEEGQERVLDKRIIEAFSFNETGLSPWIEEGIGREALERFNIKYDMTENAIIIPNLNHNGDLIGIRGRFMSENAFAKYMPIKYQDEFLSFPSGNYLYGYYENKHQIRRKGIAVIFEGEKSVLKMETLYPGNNIGLATAGKRITFAHLSALLKLNIREVVLAYDRDYNNLEERKKILAEYREIAKILDPYFEVSIIIDHEYKTGYKDSPIDCGKEIFEELMKNRLKR